MADCVASSWCNVRWYLSWLNHVQEKYTEELLLLVWIAVEKELAAAYLACVFASWNCFIRCSRFFKYKSWSTWLQMAIPWLAATSYTERHNSQVQLKCNFIGVGTVPPGFSSCLLQERMEQAAYWSKPFCAYAAYFALGCCRSLCSKDCSNVLYSMEQFLQMFQCSVSSFASTISMVCAMVSWFEVPISFGPGQMLLEVMELLAYFEAVTNSQSTIRKG